MKILVTGGTGGVGTAVAARLVQNGHEVRVADIKPPENPLTGVDYRVCDITVFDQVCEAVRGMEGIAHLAAYPSPSMASGQEIYRVNCWGTFNIFEAAAKEGIRRIAQASSINAFGNGYGVQDVPLKYFPIDEDHPTLTSDPYSYSKETVESIAAYYWRREGISSASLRMPFVVVFDERFAFMSKGVAMFRQALDDLLQSPEGKQREWIEKVRGGTAKMRLERMGEKPWTPDSHFEFDPVMMASFGYTDFWAILAAEDAAQAFEKSLLADFTGSHPLFLSQRENSTGVESENLLRVFYPEIIERKRALPGAASILSYDRARQLIGFEPQVLIRERMENRE
jgi:NAD(P)-dependent dehydrogenase (short-subunit alcohol dehydrogenase family)